MSRVFARRLARARPDDRPPVVDWVGPSVLVSDLGDPPALVWQALSVLAQPGLAATVLVTPAALSLPATADVLGSALAGRRAWLAQLATAEAGDLPAVVAIAAAHDAIVARAAVRWNTGRFLYSDAGWWGRGRRVAMRHPAPPWERGFRHDPMATEGAMTESIAAGLLLRAAAPPPAAYTTPAAQDRPTLVVADDRVPLADVVEALTRFTSRPRVVLAHSARPVGEAWARSLAVLIGDPVVRQESAHDLATILGDGWQRRSPRTFRRDGLVVEVRPDVLAVRPDRAFDTVGLLDPATSTITMARAASPEAMRAFEALIGAGARVAEAGRVVEQPAPAPDRRAAVAAVPLDPAEEDAASGGPPLKTVVTSAEPGLRTPGLAKPVGVPLGGPIAWRASTLDEQRRFIAALGDQFTNSLAVVNAALSTWPSLRGGESTSGKAEFAAVCIYLGRTEGGAVSLNELLRTGSRPELDGYLECLVAGVQRLPLVRRPVLWQVDAAMDYPDGTVVAEPGLRSAAITPEVAAQGATADVLVLPRTARQLSVLAPGRELDEAVFLPGTRFRVLATVPAEAGLPAVLMREMSDSGPAETDDDTAVERLGRLLHQRRAAAPQLLTDPDLVGRLLGPPPRAAAPGTRLHGAVAEAAG